jgi:four helix bundle protein
MEVEMTETVRNYRELKIWQKGIQVVKMVYELTKKFPQSEVYGLSSQMQRAAVSIPSNIAEGQARQHSGEFRQFLYTALGSAAELDTQLVLAVELEYATKEVTQPIIDLLLEIRKMTYALIKKLPQK